MSAERGKAEQIASDIIDRLFRSASEHPESPAFVFPDEGVELTRSQLLEATAELASGLAAFCQPGDRVAIQLPQGRDYVVTFWACLYAGLVAIPLYPVTKTEARERIEKVLRDSRASLVVTAGRSDPLHGLPHVTIDEVKQAGANRHPRPAINHDLAYLQYSSGSTGAPKGVMISHGNIEANLRMIATAAVVTHDDVFVSWLPLHHDLGLVNTILLPAFANCRSIVLPPLSFVRRPMSWLEAISRHGGTISGAPNFAYRACVDRRPERLPQGLDLSRWRVAFNAAEPVQAETLQAFSDIFEHAGFKGEAFFPAYGLAEATVFVSGGFWRPAAASPPQAGGGRSKRGSGTVACGPVDPAQVVIVDRQGQRCAEDQEGEIWITGDHVSRGYFGSVSRDEGPFCSHLASGDGPYFATGDSGVCSEGSLHVLGRIKETIIQNGRNLFPTDIEQVAHAALVGDRRFAGVAAVGLSRNGTEAPVLLVECRGDVGTDDPALLGAASSVLQVLGIVLQGVSLVPLGTIKRTSSGKIRRVELRRALEQQILPVLSLGPADDGATRDDAGLLRLEAEIAAIASTLSDRCIAPGASLASQGFSSLEMAQLAIELEDRLGVHVSAGDLFEYPTIGLLAKAVLDRRRPDAREEPKDGASGALSDNQRMMLAIDAWAPGSKAYHLPLILRFAAEVDAGTLARAVERTVATHEILRTIYPATGSAAPSRSGLIRDAAEFHVDMVSVQEDGVDALMRQLVGHPFDLSKDLPVRATIMEVAGDGPGKILALVAHHIAADGVSMRLIADEVLRRYTSSEQTGNGSSAVHAFKIREFPARQAEDALAYWTNNLSGFPETHGLPLDGTRTDRRDKSSRRMEMLLDAEVIDEFRSLCISAGVGLFTGLHAIFALAVARMSGEEDVVIGTFLNGRDGRHNAEQIGFLARTTLLRTRVDLERDFPALLRSCRDTLLAALRHPATSYLDLLNALKPARTPLHNPLFQLAINYHDYEADEFANGGLRAKRIPYDAQVARFDLSLDIHRLAAGLRLSFEYDEAIFHEQSIRRLARLMEELVAQTQASPSTPVGRLRLDRLLPALPPPSGPDVSSIADAFATVAERHSDRPAIRFRGQTWSYARLAGEVEGIARTLRARTRPGDRVVVFMRRQPRLVAAILAILKTDCTYVPIDPDYHRDSIRARVDFVTPACVLVDGATSGIVDQDKALELDDLDPLAEVPADGPAATGEHPAYILFTSGSTGAPKAVAMGHRPLLNLVQAVTASTGMSQPVVLGYSSFGFDMHFTETFTALLNGGTLVLVDEDQRRNTLAVLELARGEQVDLVNLAYPVLAELFNAANQSRMHLPALRTVLSTAERLKVTPGLRAFFKRHRHARLFNHYGPTETHVVTIEELSGEPSTWPSLPAIGTPISGASCLVVNRLGTPEPPGCRGELWVAGIPLAECYHAAPEMTAERFATITIGHGSGNRAYRTGDHARLTPEGSWQYLGRRDGQIKIRGLRVDLADVEASIQMNEGVSQAIVVCDEPERKRLIAYVQAVPGAAAEPERFIAALRAELATNLPSYMLPSSITLLDDFPRNQNGKVERRSLPRPAPAAVEPEEAPSTREERLVRDIWSKVLKHSSFDRRTNFFDAGGDSLALMTVTRELELASGGDLDPVQVYGRPTIESLAELLAGKEGRTRTHVRSRRNLNVTRPRRLHSSNDTEA